MSTPLTLAQAAYHAYGQVTDFKNFRGDPMPTWDELGERIHQAWIAAANAAVEAAESQEV